MFDPGSVAFEGISLIALVFGLVEFFKSVFGWEGKKVTVLAASMGVVVMVLYQLIGLVPAPYELVLKIIYTSITFGLAAAGFYKFTAPRLPTQAPKV